jgi:hypothetical protein
VPPNPERVARAPAVCGTLSGFVADANFVYPGWRGDAPLTWALLCNAYSVCHTRIDNHLPVSRSRSSFHPQSNSARIGKQITIAEGTSQGMENIGPA